jgi:hypothetical protein
MIIMTLKQLAESTTTGSCSPSSTDLNFKEMSRDDILQFLDRLRKPDDSDSLHHWIETYNNNVIVINRFFKWLYYPLIEPSKRPRLSQLNGKGWIVEGEYNIKEESFEVRQQFHR